MIRTTKGIQKTLREGPKNLDYNCDSCGWCEDEADLQSCTGCFLQLVCHECRDRKGHCLGCADIDLPDSILLVGQDQNRDVVINVRTWVGTSAGGTHYYTSVEIPSKWRRHGRLKIDLGDVKNTTENPRRVPSFIRRILKILAARHKNALRQRKDGKLRVFIDSKETVQRFMKYGVLDGD